jgi:hypothetical protein
MAATSEKPARADASTKRKVTTTPATSTSAATPAASAAASPSQGETSKASHFLREAHAAACRIFGTTLGPEANEAHRNHFHVDMAERKYAKICD